MGGAHSAAHGEADCPTLQYNFLFKFTGTRAYNMAIDTPESLR